jgi:adenylate kinase family enzyme
MSHDMRIAVLGCWGSGKTTLSRHLADHYGLPLLSIDSHRGADHRALPDFHETHSNWMCLDAWVIDGNGPHRKERLFRATHVIYLDLATWRCLTGVLRRGDCDLQFLRAILCWRRGQHVALLAQVRAHPQHTILRERPMSHDMVIRSS